MDWSLLATAAIAVVGWLAAHRFASARDRQNKKRDLRTSYLIDAYRRLESAGTRPLCAQTAAAFESAIADIQLLGTVEQVRLAQEFASQFAGQGSASLDPLLESLRRDLRSELKLEEIADPIAWLRITDEAYKKA